MVPSIPDDGKRGAAPWLDILIHSINRTSSFDWLKLPIELLKHTELTSLLREHLMNFSLPNILERQWRSHGVDVHFLLGSLDLLCVIRQKVM